MAGFLFFMMILVTSGSAYGFVTEDVNLNVVLATSSEDDAGGGGDADKKNKGSNSGQTIGQGSNKGDTGSSTPSTPVDNAHNSPSVTPQNTDEINQNENQPQSGSTEEQQPTSPPTQQQQQCPTGQHFDINVNECVNDSATTTTSGGIIVNKRLPQLSNCKEETHYDPDTGLCLYNVSSEFTPRLSDDTCPPGWRLSSDPVFNDPIACKKEEPTKTTTSPPINCPADFHYSAKKGECVSNGEYLDDGTCATDWHPRGSKCYYNNVPNLDGTCQPGWHLIINAPNSKKCEKNQPTTTPPTTPANCSEGTHLDAKTRQCVSNPIPNPNKTCPEGYHYDDYQIDIPVCTSNEVNLPLGNCAPGWHNNYPYSKCEKDTTKTTPTPINCAVDEHNDPTKGGCVSNSVYLPDGTCAAGWHLGKGAHCEKDQPTTIPTQTDNTGGTGGGTGTGMGTTPATPSQPPTDNTGGGAGGAIVVQKLPGGGCPAGYHLVADVVCIKDPITGTPGGGTTTTSTGPTSSTTPTTTTPSSNGASSSTRTTPTAGETGTTTSTGGTKQDTTTTTTSSSSSSPQSQPSDQGQNQNLQSLTANNPTATQTTPRSILDKDVVKPNPGNIDITKDILGSDVAQASPTPCVSNPCPDGSTSQSADQQTSPPLPESIPPQRSTTTPPSDSGPQATTPVQPSEPVCVPGYHWDSSQRRCMQDGPTFSQGRAGSESGD